MYHTSLIKNFLREIALSNGKLSNENLKTFFFNVYITHPIGILRYLYNTKQSIYYLKTM